MNVAVEPTTSAAESEGQKSSGGLVRRLVTWAKQHRLKAAILLLSGLTSLGAALGLYLVLGQESRQPTVTLAQALKAFDEGHLDEARRMASALRNSPQTPSGQLGGVTFVLGAIAAHEADAVQGPERKDAYLVASRYLAEAKERGFPSNREAEGLALLGRSLYLSGQVVASRPVLREALAARPQRPSEVRYLLAEACLSDATPQYEAVLEENTRYLADQGLSKEERQQGLLQRARVLLALQRTAECRATLSQIPPEAQSQAEALLLEGQLLLQEATEPTPSDPAQAADFRKRVEAAIAAFRRAEARDSSNTRLSGKAMYLIGISLLRLKEYRAALSQFGRLAKSHPDTPEALSATLQQAELSRRLGNDSEALISYRQALDHLESPEAYSNPWISLADLRKQILAVHQHYMDAERFAFASQLSAHLYPLFPRKQQMEIAAQTHHTWGDSLLAQAQALPPSKAEAVARQGREQLRRAGWQYQQLAQLRIADREYPDNLWDSANGYLKGQDFRKAAALFRQYLKTESRKRHAMALVSLSEALLASDQFSEALNSAKECIELHPRDPAAFRARLLAAQIHIARGEPDQAKRLLQENLSGEALTPASQEWQESLFTLGWLLHRQKQYEEALDRLQEAIQRYPESPRVIEARYLIADSHRMAARELEEKLKEDRVENTRVTRSRKVRELLSRALAEYRELQEKLSQRQETEELSNQERLTLRDCYFSIGHILFQLQQYDEAIKAYVMVTNRYQSSPEVLDAYLQIARAYHKLNKPADARAAVEQAKMVLARMKPDVAFKETTNFTRQEWVQVLEEASRGKGVGERS